MQCDVCFRTGGDKLPFLCPVDARNQLYKSRIDHAVILLENDRLTTQITSLTTGDASGDHERVNIEYRSAAKDICCDRTRDITAQVDDLRQKIEASKAVISKKKTIVARRKSELASGKNGLEPRRARLLEDADKASKMRIYRWNQNHKEMAQSRAFLVTEAAKLYGLQQLCDAQGGLSDDYSIAGVPILDLRAMCNKAMPAEITSSLTQIARLLVLTAHYFSLRLPAEITLPHRDYPLPTIFHLKESYTQASADVPFPGITSTHSTGTSPSTSRHEDEIRRPRPRPLFINKPLPALSKEDLCMFLEGASLLAYNVAWMCKIQGVSVGSPKGITTVEDIFEIGSNLFKVLIGSTPRPSPAVSDTSAPLTPTKLVKGQESSGTDAGRLAIPPVSSLIGHFSHGTAHTFLGAAQGADFQRSFKLPNPMKIGDQLKAHVLSEVAGTGWTLVGDDANVDDDDLETGDGVLVGGGKDQNTSKRDSKRKNHRAMMSNTKGLSDFGAASFMTMQTVITTSDGAEEKKIGTKGWTLLKDRS